MSTRFEVLCRHRAEGSEIFNHHLPYSMVIILECVQPHTIKESQVQVVVVLERVQTRTINESH